MSTCFLLFGLLAALATQLLFNAQTFNVLLKKQRVPFDNAGEAELPLQHVGDVESVETLELMGEDDAAASAAPFNHPPPKPPRPPPKPPSSPKMPPAPQPDELRLQSAASEVATMRCNEAIPPESIFTSSTGGGGKVTVHAKSWYRHQDDTDLHAFGYDIEFTNEGSSVVQLLSRHWVFVDAEGKVEEMKGPGARGMLPILKPSEKFRYSSGTRIATERGSMHGWFTFEDVRTANVFSVRVSRLALSSTGSSAVVPCASPADGTHTLPTTSIHSTDRVLVGANTELASFDEDTRSYVFTVDVQVNNARSETVWISQVVWELIDANGQRFQSTSSVGTDEGGVASRVVRLPPGVSMRLKATLPKISTPKAKLSGELLARFGDPAEALSDDSTPVFGDDDEEDDDEAEEEATRQRHLVIAPLGCSISGDPVRAYEPLGFLVPGI